MAAGVRKAGYDISDLGNVVRLEEGDRRSKLRKESLRNTMLFRNNGPVLNPRLVSSNQNADHFATEFVVVLFHICPFGK